MNTGTEAPYPSNRFAVEQDEEDPRFYNLIRGEKKGYHMLEIVREDGSYFCVLYHDIHTLEGTADGTKLTLCIKGGLLVTLVGERLKTLCEYLKAWRVCKLYRYEPEKQNLKDEHAPIVWQIIEMSSGMVKPKEAVQP
jgi:hypothetical protein